MANHFTRDFEDNRLIDASTFHNIAVVAGGTQEVTAGAAMVGTYGLEITPLVGKVNYIGEYVFPMATRFRQAFHFDPNGMTMGVGESMRLALDMRRYETPYRIIWQDIAGVQYIRAYCKLDNNTEVYTAAVLLTDQKHCVEWDWMAASAPGANDGYLTLWVDEVLCETLSGVDNDQQVVCFPCIGVCKNDIATVTGSFYLDHWVANTDGAALVTGWVPVPVSFTIDFEANDFTECTATVLDGGHLAIAGAAAMGGGSYGISCELADVNVMYVSKTISSVVGKARVRFYLDVNSLTMATAERIHLLMIRNASSMIAGVHLYRASTQYQITGVLTDDGTVNRNTTMANISDAVHYIECRFLRASSAVASDGTVEIFVDGVSVGSLTNVDNYDKWSLTNYVRFGVPYFEVGAPTGTLYLDKLDFNDQDTEIGA